MGEEKKERKREEAGKGKGEQRIFEERRKTEPYGISTFKFL